MFMIRIMSSQFRQSLIVSPYFILSGCKVEILTTYTDTNSE